MPAAFCAIFLRDWTQCIDSFSLLLLRCVWKGVDAKNPAILRSFNLMQCKWSKSKNCDWNLGNTPISREPPITNRISWNLPRKYWNTLGSRILEKKGKWNASIKNSDTSPLPTKAASTTIHLIYSAELDSCLNVVHWHVNTSKSSRCTSMAGIGRPVTKL